MVDGVVYSTAGTRRAVVALDAGTGEMLWMHSENEGKRGEAAPRQLSGRGLSYWTDGTRRARIVYVTPGYQMVALDAKTGMPVAGVRQERHRRSESWTTTSRSISMTGEIGLHATPIIAKDVIVVGAAHLPGGAPEEQDAREGLHPRLRRAHRQAPLDLPHDSAAGRVRQRHLGEGFVVVHRQRRRLGADDRRRRDSDTVFLPVELPTGDYYGGHRPGNGLFGESLVALDLKTGQRKWHYQLVHHGIWDMDIPCAPILMDLIVDGRRDQGGRAADQAGLDLHVRSRSPASRCGRSKSARSRRATCRASGIRRRSRSSPSRRLTIARASRSTI